MRVPKAGNGDKGEEEQREMTVEMERTGALMKVPKAGNDEREKEPQEMILEMKRTGQVWEREGMEENKFVDKEGKDEEEEAEEQGSLLRVPEAARGEEVTIVEMERSGHVWRKMEGVKKTGFKEEEEDRRADEEVGRSGHLSR